MSLEEREASLKREGKEENNKNCVHFRPREITNIKGTIFC
jgi:hypothetical protein